MNRYDLQLTTPAEQLAADEVFLDLAETGGIDECLLFWEPRETFVVVGYANKVAAEVNVSACEKKAVPIFRRCSGGGTVVQMPGGLNYSLILRIEDHGPTRNISAANQFIMERNRVALEQAGGDGCRIAVRGHTDLTRIVQRASGVTERKFAGNAQRRRRNFLLFHGTLLLDCDLELIPEFLSMPSLQPDYRAGRAHLDFVANLQLPPEQVRSALASAWNASEPGAKAPQAEIARLAREKYLSREWNFKF